MIRQSFFSLLFLPLILVMAAGAAPLYAQEELDEAVEIEEAEDTEPPASLLPVTVPAPVGVSISAASELPVDNFGVLDPEKSGFATNAWEGVAYDRAVELVKNIPLSLQSRVLRSLVYRLLAAQTNAPEKEESDGSLLEARIRMFFLLGENEKALAMIDALPNTLVTEDIRQTKVEALLLKPDILAACEDVKKAVESYDAPYWQQLVIFCQAQAGNADGAQLGLNLLREQNRTPNEYFLSIVESFKDPDAAITFPEELSVLESAMLLATGREELVKTRIETLSLPALLAVGADARFAPSTRTLALEHATAKGISARDITDLYTALSSKKKEERPEMVELYRKLTRERSLSPKLERTVTLVEHFDKQQARTGAYALLHFVIRETAARPQVKLMNADFLFHALNVLWLGNMEREAESLVKRLSASGSRALDTELYKEIAAGMKALSNETAPITGLSSKALSGISDVTSARDGAHALRLLAVLSALGYDMGESATLSSDMFPYSSNVVAPPADLVKAFEQAVELRHKAAAVLLAAQLMGNTPLEKLSDEVIASIVGGLHTLGFEKEARTLAREAVIYSAT